MESEPTGTATADIVVHHNAQAQRFEALVEGELCRANYRQTGNVLAMNHTEVPRRLQGRGIARALVRTAVEFARANGLLIAAHCSYVRGYFQRHPEAQDVLARI